MADKNPNEATSSSGHTPETSDAYVELNIKTLDSQVHSFRVRKNMSVPSFKEQIASAVGVPAVQQRLIFRGKVLKDDHLLSDYNVEDGHTLHLVVRQPVQSQSPAGTGSATTASLNVDQSGSEPTAGGSRTRTGQISHSVVLGSFNIGDQVEDIVPDISRIIGAVLNSVGLGNLSAANGASSNQIPNNNAPDRGAQGGESDGSRATGRGREETANQIPHGPTPANTTSQFLPQFRQLLSGVAAVPSQSLVIPDSLTTLSEFISQMELMLSAYGNHHQSTSSTNRENTQPSDNSSSQSRGLPTPESLSSVIRRVQQLLGGHAGAALSHIAERIEGQSAVTDPTVRNQIQAEAVHLGIAMQHLGALFLELGRTTQMLRMGPSPAEAIVNSGPAVYVSRHGPNPLMVQPSPFQPSSLFGTNSVIPVQLSSASPAQLSPLDISRNINIHIHAGTSAAQGLSLAGARATGEVSNTQVQNAEQANPTAANSAERRDPGPARLLPIRTVVAAVPARPAEAPNHVLSLFYPMHARSQQTSIPQQTTVNSSAPGQGPSTTVSGGADFVTSTGSSQQLTVTSQAEMHVRGVDGDPSSGSHSGGSSSTTADVSHSARMPQVQDADVVNSANRTVASLKPGSSEHVLESCVPRAEHVEVPVVNQFNNSDNMDRRMNSTFAASIGRPEESTYFSTTDEAIHQKSDCEMTKKVSVPTSDRSRDASRDKAVPLGLGLGGLQPLPSKRKSRTLKQQKVDGQASNSASSSYSQDTMSRGQSILRSLVSEGQSGTARADANGSSLRSPSLVGQLFDKMSSEHVAGSGQADVTSMMSQVLSDSTFNNLLSGISTQAGGVSPDVFRNVLGQFASSPSVRNAFEQVVHQVDDQDVEKMLSGLGAGQGIDFSRMFQQMLPVVTKALGGMSASSVPLHDISTGFQAAVEDRRPHAMEHELNNSQIDMQDTARLIESHSSPGAVFRAMVTNAGGLSGIGVDDSGLIDDLCTDELADEYMQMLYGSLRRRLDSEGRSEDGS
ncbi:uncharacterized protein LOC116247603 [Nymphaea colorata]|nr:uncharacterized protein LOC116247603 [Nymphaea colorata]